MRTAKEIVTKRGLELGIDPRHSEDIASLIDKDTSGIIQPLHDTRRQQNVADTDYIDEFVTIIMKDSNGFYKGWGERDFNGKTFRIVTETYRDINECGRELKKSIRILAKQLRYLN
jgi:hypothetical protein